MAQQLFAPAEGLSEHNFALKRRRNSGSCPEQLRPTHKQSLLPGLQLDAGGQTPVLPWNPGDFSPAKAQRPDCKIWTLNS